MKRRLSEVPGFQLAMACFRARPLPDKLPSKQQTKLGLLVQPTQLRWTEIEIIQIKGN